MTSCCTGSCGFGILFLKANKSVRLEKKRKEKENKKVKQKRKSIGPFSAPLLAEPLQPDFSARCQLDTTRG